MLNSGLGQRDVHDLPAAGRLPLVERDRGAPTTACSEAIESPG